jgi:hypothetical protein
VLPGPFFDVRDPSGNRVQIVQYDEIQFTKAERVLEGMELELGLPLEARRMRARGLEQKLLPALGVDLAKELVNSLPAQSPIVRARHAAS